LIAVNANEVRGAARADTAAPSGGSLPPTKLLRVGLVLFAMAHRSKPGRLSHLEAANWKFYRYLAAQLAS
jgi:hypothetical protein